MITAGDLVDFAVLLALYVFVFYRKWRAKGKDVLLVNTVMYIYLACVVYFTLMPVIVALPFVFDHAYVPMNMTPFIDVAMGRGDYERQIILNVIMMVPFGFLCPLVRKMGFGRVILYTFLLSLTIELLQPLLSNIRSSDITDLITNVTGGVIGYGVYYLTRPVTRRVLCRLTR